MFQDEVHFQVSATVARKWVAKGSRPAVKSAPTKKSLKFSGFVVPKTGELWTANPQWFNFETTISCVRGFLAARQGGGKVCLVLDNAAWHKKAARVVEENAGGAYSDIAARAEFLFLPPYSPDLNPIEMVWRKTRREVTHNTYFKDCEAVGSALRPYFSRFAKPNAELSKLCSFMYS